MRKKIALRLLHLFSLLPSTLAAMVCYDIVAPMHPEVLTPVDCWPSNQHSSLMRREIVKGVQESDILVRSDLSQVHRPLDSHAAPVSGILSGVDDSGSKGGAIKDTPSSPADALDPPLKNTPPSPTPATSPNQIKAVPTSKNSIVQNQHADVVQAENNGRISTSSPVPSPQRTPTPKPTLPPAPAPAPLAPPFSNVESPKQPAESSSPSQPLLNHPKLSNALSSGNGEASWDKDKDNDGDSDSTKGHDNDGNKGDQDNAPANLPFFDFAPDSPLSAILNAPALPAPTWSEPQAIFFNLDCDRRSYTSCQAMSQTLDLAGWYVSQVNTFGISDF